ncbi:calcipressin-2-like [Anneissia japonica]|uniref:calcipressin-2-like n=1 Tax=Anneissia japonica TaxID=1529436 RepID=UPI001425AF37|nr:calcipressin-2-like [Anneissia japonica]
MQENNVFEEERFGDHGQNWETWRDPENWQRREDNGVGDTCMESRSAVFDDGGPMFSESSVDIDYYDLPTSIVATNIDDDIFRDNFSKKVFESMCCAFGENVTFQYFPSFRRVRINYETPEQVVQAQLALHKKEINGKVITSYFIQPPRSVRVNPTLQPPKATKQFLISPPASPPVGWEPVSEAEPVVNYNILAAMANLAPGQEHELHAGDGNIPSIVVLPCEDPPPKQVKAKIEQTKCPPRR